MMPNTLNCAAVTALVFAVGLQSANADTKTWGWTEAPAAGPNGLPVLQEVWREADGASGHLLGMGGGTEVVLTDLNGDAKAVVVRGSVRAADLSVGRHGFALLPAAEGRRISCRAGGNCLVYLEVEPASAAPAAAAIAAADIPWFDVPNTGRNVSLAWVWGEAETTAPSGFFLRFQPGFPGFRHAHTHAYQGIVLQGAYSHWEPKDGGPVPLPVGASFWQQGRSAHDDACGVGEPCIAYFRIVNAFDVFPAD